MICLGGRSTLEKAAELVVTARRSPSRGGVQDKLGDHRDRFFGEEARKEAI